MNAGILMLAAACAGGKNQPFSIGEFLQVLQRTLVLKRDIMLFESSDSMDFTILKVNVKKVIPKRYFKTGKLKKG